MIRKLRRILEDLCRYTCLTCQEPLSSLSLLRAHMRASHGDTNEHPSLDVTRMARLVLFACPLCEAVLPCDKSHIFEHAQRRHSMNGSTFRFVHGASAN